MIFKLHYWLNTSGASALGILLGAFIETYTDASPVEIGALFMMMPFLGLLTRPVICSFADRQQAHREYLIWCLLITAVSYCPFVIIPMLGETFYGQHPRLTWYVLLVLKVFGDIAFGAVQSIGDTLAMNYSRRVGVEYTLYRIWGTVAWIFFGVVIGQINEIWFLPKYAPAFMILIICTLLDMALFWLWPREYFVMLTEEEMVCELREKRLKYCSGNSPADNEKLEARLASSLMPRELVWAHMRMRFKSIFTLFRRNNNQTTTDIQPKSYLPTTLNPNELVQNGTSKSDSLSSAHRKLQQTDSGLLKQKQQQQQHSDPIDKTTQIRTLLTLIKRDPRIIGYSLIFVLGGLHSITTNFLFINLNEICNQQGLCNYSSLGGWLQASMASAETVVFVYIKNIQNAIGRVNLAGIGLILLTVKFGFYATIWYSIDPYWSLLIEVIQGAVFAIFLTQQVETAHMFANEVEHILPELRDKRIIKDTDDIEKVKLSLSATMQAVMINAENGIGRGFGALIFGIIIQNYSYRALWIALTFLFGISCIITFAVNIACYLLNLEVGPNKSSHLKKVNLEATSNSFNVVNLSPPPPPSEAATRTTVINLA